MDKFTCAPRVGDWMQTYTGRKFWPLDPRVEDFDILDIAHALSLTCRFNGHCIEFYSVAEHSCHIYDKAPYPKKKQALLHDAPEGYISDIVTPLKRYMPEFREIEDKIFRSLARRYEVSAEIDPIVHILDKSIVRDELINMRNVPAEWNIPARGIGVKIQLWSPKRAEYEFLKRAKACGIDTGPITHPLIQKVSSFFNRKGN